MIKKYRNMIKEIKSVYPTINFDIIKEEDSLQLLCNNKDLISNDSYLDIIGDIVIKYLDMDEQNIFAVVYDYDNQISIVSEVEDEYNNHTSYGEYMYKGLNTFNITWDMEGIAA